MPTSVRRVGGEVLVGDARETEIEDLDQRRGRSRCRPGLRFRGLLDDDVRRLEVAVDHSALVGVVHSVGDRAKQPQPELELVRGDRRRASRCPCTEGLAPDQLHGEEVVPVVGVTRLVDGRDIGVLQPAEGLGLALEETGVDLVDQVSAAHDLERDASLGVLLLGLVNDAHATLAEHRDDPVAADRRGQRGRRPAPGRVRLCSRPDRDREVFRRLHRLGGCRRIIGVHGVVVVAVGHVSRNLKAGATIPLRDEVARALRERPRAPGSTYPAGCSMPNWCASRALSSWSATSRTVSTPSRRTVKVRWRRMRRSPAGDTWAVSVVTNGDWG